MSISSRFVLAPGLLAACAALGVGACNGQVTNVLGPEPTTPALGSNDPPDAVQQTSGKVDLLLAVDDSSSMRPKQALFARAAARMVDRLTRPNCVDAARAVTARSTIDEHGQAVCPEGTSLEFAPVTDLHVGLISSSLGNFGNEGPDAVCSEDAVRGAHLVVPRTFRSENAGYLAFGSGVAPYTDPAELQKAVEDLVLSTDDRGCGIEAQLESLYQFLVAPEPWGKIATRDGASAYEGVNLDLLRQRHDFLRPDSLVSVVLVTDEDDASVDPLSVGGSGRYFAARSFPQSSPSQSTTRAGDQTTTAARGTSVCDATPNASECTSCAFAFNSPPDPTVASDPRCANPETAYFGSTDDDMNVRFFDMKRRFGIEPRYPLTRYTKALSSLMIPGRDAEHLKLTPPVSAARSAKTYDEAAANCRNPLFAAALPSEADQELCNLPAGTRNSSLVYFTVLGGAPNELLAADALDADQRLTDAAWTKLLGRDFEASDYTGVDPRMLQSVAPRAGRPKIDGVDAEAVDPMNRTHREWDTAKNDLQFACTYPLPAELVVGASESIDCGPGSDAPLCEPGDHATARRQIRGRAFPTPRPFAVARSLGRQATIGSLCAADVSDPNADGYGYSPIVDALVDRLAAGLRK